MSYHLKRQLRFDPRSEKFEDREANARLSKPYRDKYPLPAL
jgi:hypothetical protein